MNHDTLPATPLRLNSADLDHIGTLDVTGAEVLVGDPCYYDDYGTFLAQTVTCPAGAGSAECYVQRDPHSSVTTRLVVLFTGVPGQVEAARPAGYLPVDGAQMSVIDARRYHTQWQRRTAAVLARYVHASGAHLDHPGDFRRYDQPITSQGGRSMTELIATGEWTETPVPGQQDFSFPGLCAARDASPLDAAVMDRAAFITGSGYGDGRYVLEHLLDRRGVTVGLNVTFAE